MKNNFSKTFVVLISITLLTSSCFKNFYLTNSQNSLGNIDAKNVNEDPNKYIIVHFSDQPLELTKYTITKESIEGEINKIEIPEHILYLNPDESSSNSYKKRYESAVLNEVHIYTALKSNIQNTNHIQIASKDISRIDIYKKDHNRTSQNHILSSFGVAAIIGGFLAIIAMTMTFNIGTGLIIM